MEERMTEINGLDGRRPCLQSVNLVSSPAGLIRSDAHTGLWIDKFLPHQEKGAGQKKADHFKQAIRPVDGLYEPFYRRWETALQEAGAQMHKATVKGRLAIGLGGESVLETSISLHHTYGVPYIPGSALKGLAAHYAKNRLEKWDAGTDAYQIVFGDTKSAGYVTFYDALYFPGSANYGEYKDTPLALDVMTVHHPDYYGGKKESAPADWDSPTPISFLSATGSYLIALGGPQEWVEAAFKILAGALRDEGVGAKTSSGYGRMEVDGVECEKVVITKSPVMIETVPPVIANHPPKGAEWKKGKISRDGRTVYALDMPETQIRFQREHVLPKGYTPGAKSEVQFLVESLPDGSQRVWVKQMYHPVE
jgi:CRISPR-associated protein Cmr6